jgi:purine-cytosine permease-like protein
MSGESSAAETTVADSVYIQPTLNHGLRVWWAFYWRNTLLSLVVMVFIAALLQILSVPAQSRQYVMTYGQYVVFYILVIFMIHYIVRRKYRDFRLSLVSANSDTPQILKPTLKRTLRVWLTYTWRSLLYVAIASVAINVSLGFLTGAVAIIFPSLARVFPALIGFVVAAAVGLFVVYSNILDEEFGEFRVILAPVGGATDVGRAPVPDTVP